MPNEKIDEKLRVGDWVLVVYDETVYPGEVTALGAAGHVHVSAMRKASPGQNWKWPDMSHNEGQD